MPAANREQDFCLGVIQGSEAGPSEKIELSANTERQKIIPEQDGIASETCWVAQQVFLSNESSAAPLYVQVMKATIPGQVMAADDCF